ncbi:MAG: peptidylprolyl isomerase [Clostridia bacterium]|nr:peptidylprolyl isomerase [Clostridia bacterium]
MFKNTTQTTDFVKIEMENGGAIVVELNGDAAPISVQNFKKLVGQGFYDGLIFHRVISGFMIQGGDPQGTGMGGSRETIKGEFAVNGVNNPISHERGVISMARSQFYNSASSQFFICHADAKFLDGQYAAFGKVVEGMETVDAIAMTPTDRGDRPLSTQRMAKVCFVEKV